VEFSSQKSAESCRLKFERWLLQWVSISKKGRNCASKPNNIQPRAIAQIA